jgi:hypothetical protein
MAGSIVEMIALVAEAFSLAVPIISTVLKRGMCANG